MVIIFIIKSLYNVLLHLNKFFLKMKCNKIENYSLEETMFL